MLAEAKQRFLQSLAAEGRSPRTLVNYREAIDQLAGFILATDPARILEDVGRDDIEKFILYLRRNKRTDSTVQNRFRSLRRFFNWCQAQRLIATSPVKQIKTPVVRPEAVLPYTEEEVERLMAAAQLRPSLALRDETIIALLYNTGVRAGELCTLRPECVREGAILVRGKGKRERWIALEVVTLRLLTSYMAGRDGRYIFNLSVSGLHKLVRTLAHAADVPGAYVHRFRDTFAVRFLENGGGVDQLQIILGHQQIDTTLRYVQWGKEQRAMAAHRKFAPFAKLAG